jgi:tetratricopeptide (TPR) repeat protein
MASHASGIRVSGDAASTPVDLDSLWDFADPAASETRFLDAAAAAGLRHDERRLTALTQAARAQGLQRRFDDANATLDQVVAAIRSGQHEARVRLALERGRVLRSSGLAERSVPSFQAALDEATTAGLDALAVDAAHMLANVAHDRGDWQASLNWNRCAIGMAERSHAAAARRWLASLLNNAAWTLHGQQRFEEAQGKPEPIRTARWSVARVLRSLNRLEEALAIQRELLREHEAAGTGDGFVQEELAECLLALGHGEEARPHFRRAYAELTRDVSLAEREPMRLQRLNDLAKPGT